MSKEDWFCSDMMEDRWNVWSLGLEMTLVLGAARSLQWMNVLLLMFILFIVMGMLLWIDLLEVKLGFLVQKPLSSFLDMSMMVS